MFSRLALTVRGFMLLLAALLISSINCIAATSWSGVLRDAVGNPVDKAEIRLQATDSSHEYSATTTATGQFTFTTISAGSYRLNATALGKTWTAIEAVQIQDGSTLVSSLQLAAQGQELRIIVAKGMEKVAPRDARAPQASGGEHLSTGEVSSLPLNERDFSKLLLLAAGTMTDTNGAANFTQQFAVNGQRGSAAVFAMDGADTTDPELGGATFSNFNVDAIQEVQSGSGVMLADIGHGAAGFTNVITKSGSDSVHGSLFEFVRNAAFDARNFFDHASAINPRRLPPFARNEFGATIGGPAEWPRIYNGRGKTYFFAEYQGFRQVLGTTQVMPVPTLVERQGIDTTSFPGDTLTVPVNGSIVALLARYPLPNEPSGPYGARTYATSSKVVNDTNQASARIDHRFSEKSALFLRASRNQVRGPTTDPDQTAIDPTFGVDFLDHQRSAAVKYSRNTSSRFSYQTTLGYIRSTPLFLTSNQTQPAIAFADGLYQGFNSADGSIFGSYGNVYQFKEDMVLTRGAHTLQWGAELRFNRDTTIFGTNPDGLYTFGGGTAYSPVFIPSASGHHDLQPGQPLPDALTGLLTATPFSYTVTALGSLTPKGNKFDAAAVRREAYNFYLEDAWKVTGRFTVTLGLRYEVNSRIHEAHHRTSLAVPIGPDGKLAGFLSAGTTQVYRYNPQPPYVMDWNGWGPRVSLEYGLSKHTTVHAAGAITTILPNLWLENYVTGAFPFEFQPLVTALPGFPLSFQDSVAPLTLPPVYTTQGQLLFPNVSSSNLPANMPMDVQRFQNDLAARTPGNQVQLFTAISVDPHLRNGYIATQTLGIDQDLGGVKVSASYVGTAGVHLASVLSPNGYGGASPAFARYTQFNAAGQATGGFGPELVMSTGAHSSYHALQASASQNMPYRGLSFQASYTFSKSIDDTSAVPGGISGTPGVVLQTLPQDPFHPEKDRGPSTFDVTHVFAVSLIQRLPLERVRFFQPLGKTLTRGWQFLDITTLTSGSPFSVYSGIQQTGVGVDGSDRPDLESVPDFSTSRTVREDYFGRGAANSTFFQIPINVPGGTGPNQGVFGVLGRNTFRGPAFRQFDMALIKDTAFGRRGNGEFANLQFRAEFFNIFNEVNFGLPSNIVRGSGFGIISKTAGPSRQIQFSLKLNY
ncbi:MAG TPA: TonB-dependent receptor [Candidatus Acidoferrum sp.]|nr:TonB-dependent receptor [Candidatus Acidoferrum sp.]